MINYERNVEHLRVQTFIHVEHSHAFDVHALFPMRIISSAIDLLILEDF